MVNAHEKLVRMYVLIEKARAAWTLVGPKYSEWGSEVMGCARIFVR